MIEPLFPKAAATTRPDEEVAEQPPRLLPPFHVILLNDDHHSFEFVIEVLRKAIGFSEEHAFLVTQEAHAKGRAIVWTGPKEVAELKAEQMHTCREIRKRDQADLGPLGCTIEPAPGA